MNLGYDPPDGSDWTESLKKGLVKHSIELKHRMGFLKLVKTT